MEIDKKIIIKLIQNLEDLRNGQVEHQGSDLSLIDIIENIGLNRSITSQRTNGFISSIAKIHQQIENLENAK